jgi:Cu/Ag efflux pump CusA
VIVQIVCLGLSTADVEELVTVPLEQALNGVEGLDILRSKSSPQLSSVELIFDRGVDLIKARRLVQERMTAVSATLPTWAAPPVMLAPASATSRAVKIGMTSDDQSLIQMSMTAYWTIRARLLQVPGVANVTLWGERLQMLQVQVRPDDLRARDITLNQVMETTAEAVDSRLLLHSVGSIIGPGGIVETPNQRLNVRNVLPVITPADLGRVPVQPAEGAEAGGPVVRLDDVAEVVEDHQPLLGDGAVNNELGLMLIVEKLPWADTSS